MVFFSSDDVYTSVSGHIGPSDTCGMGILYKDAAGWEADVWRLTIDPKGEAEANMYALVHSIGLMGLEGFPVTVETDISGG